MKKKVVAIIPARGGSKGILRKNIQPLGGKPLIAWSIEAALKSEMVDRVIVSTEDEEIAAIAREWGGEVPFMRPAEMATDHSNAGEAVNHAQTCLSHAGEEFHIIMVLYPTHPFRTKKMFETAVHALGEGGCDTFVTVRSLKTPFGKYVKLDKKGLARPLSGPGLPSVHYRQYGLLMANNRTSNYGGTYVYPINGAASLIDIDEPRDMADAQAVLYAGLYDYYE